MTILGLFLRGLDTFLFSLPNWIHFDRSSKIVKPFIIR